MLTLTPTLESHPSNIGDEFNSQFSLALLTESLFRVHMGRELMLEYPSFRDSIESMDRALQDLEHAPSWSIKGKTTQKPLMYI